jgi:hypothetical protein
MRRDRREMTLRGATCGALLGFAWGISARLWMRFIATDPQFTWNGTAYIVLVPTVIGLMMGVALATHRRWAKIVGGIAVIPLGMGAGTLMLPTIIFGALSFGRRTLPIWSRVVFGFLGALPVLAVFQEASKQGSLKTLAAMLLYLALCAGMIGMASVSLGSVGAAIE